MPGLGAGLDSALEVMGNGCIRPQPGTRVKTGSIRLSALVQGWVTQAGLHAPMLSSPGRQGSVCGHSVVPRAGVQTQASAMWMGTGLWDGTCPDLAQPVIRTGLAL